MTTAHRWRVGAVVGAGVLATGIALGLSNAAVVRAPTDSSIYYVAARVLVSGGNPYDWLALQHVVTTVPAPGYVYPLWGLFLVLPLVWLPLPFAAGIWLVANLSALAIALMLLVHLSGLATRSYWLRALFAVTCLSIPGLFAVIQGQISLLLLAILVAAFWAVRTDRGSWAGVLLALALLKPQLTWLPVLAVLALAWRRGSGRAALLAGGKAMAALCGLSFILQPGWVGGWIAALGQDAGQGGRGAAALRANMGPLPAFAWHLPAPI